jgi:hypothetical protein
MKWAALIAWVITAGGGFAMFGLWLRGGGMRQGDHPGRLIRPPLILGHLLLAATGLVLWIIYLVSGSDALAWISFVLLVFVALLGFTMFAIWVQQRKEAPGAAVAAGEGGAGTVSRGGSEPAERRFPVPIVAAHGLLAATTLVLVLLAAAGVGD